MRRVLIIVAFLVFAGVGASGQRAIQPADPGSDFYYFEGTPIRLLRSDSEVLVRMTAERSLPAASLLSAVGSDAQVVREISTARGTFRLLSLATSNAPARRAEADRAAALDRVRAVDGVDLVMPVFHHPVATHRLMVTDELNVKLGPGLRIADLPDLAMQFRLAVDRPVWGSQSEFVLRLRDARIDDVLERSRALWETGWFAWAEPNFIQEYRRQNVPDDPLFAEQWHLANTGQSGGVPGADVSALAAWQIQQGSPEVTIAILDDGVQTVHEDLAPNIFANPGEVPGNGVDDDGNGFVDDVQGWDFQHDDPDPNPHWIYDNHGTAVAGIAAGRARNGIGISGLCPECRILPVRVDLTSDETLATAIRYAGSFADVLNNSWSGGAPSAVIRSAIQDVVANGRGGLGAVVIFAAGNDASGWGAGGHGLGRYTPPSIPAGTHRFRWEYSKDASGAAGDDSAWIPWVLLPGSTLVDFEEGLPRNWSTGGDAPWTVITDFRYADESVCLTRAIRAGAISDGQMSYVEVVHATGGTSAGLYYPQWVSSGTNDGLRLRVDLFNDGTYEYTSPLYSWPTTVTSGLAYPAAHPEAISVGASGHLDCRAHYSQFGPELSLVAPSSGGALNPGIVTTDRAGPLSGYAEGAFTEYFGGTSAASPLVAGAAALVIAQNPTLTAAEVRDILQRSADKVGPAVYAGGRNDRYGSGRLNAHRALLETPAPPAIPPLIVVQPRSQIIGWGETVTLDVSASGSMPFAYQWYRGDSGDSRDPVAGGTSRTFTSPALTAPDRYWVRVSNAFGSADSGTALIELTAAVFDPALRVPRCVHPGAACDSGSLLDGRGASAAEPNFPNTLYGQCTDGEAGIRHQDESIDRIRVYTLDGSPFRPGATVRVEVTIFAIGYDWGSVDLFAAGDIDQPGWMLLGSIPALAPGTQVVSTTYVLPSGDRQIIRARYPGGRSQNPCNGSFEGAYTDNDDLVFAVLNPPEPPAIVRQPAGSVGTDARLTVLATGHAPTSYQWYEGSSGDTARPVPGGTRPTVSVGSLTETTSYWVRLTNAAGSVDSATATVVVPVASPAEYDGAFGAPVCASWAGWCDTGPSGLLWQWRLNERNGPNTLHGSCSDLDFPADADEWVDRIHVWTVDGTLFGPGKTVRVDVTVNVMGNVHNRLDLFYAADAANPRWMFMATLQPVGRGLQTLSAAYVLPAGTRQAVRARLRRGGTAAPCGGDVGGTYADHDDLVFVTGPIAPGSGAPVILEQPQDQTLFIDSRATMRVRTAGAEPLSFQWYRGVTGDTSRPIPDAKSAVVRVLNLLPNGGIWVRVSNAYGSIDSATAYISTVAYWFAGFDSTLQAPRCPVQAPACSTGSAVEGRGRIGLAGETERNYPNTIDACTDGSGGWYREDESIEDLRIASMDGNRFAPGGAVMLAVELYAFSSTSNYLDLYYAADATNPIWQHLVTLRPTIKGYNVLSALHVLPSGGLQAIRARLRYEGTAGPCGSGLYDDHDDLVFATTDTMLDTRLAAPAHVLPVVGGLIMRPTEEARTVLQENAPDGGSGGDPTDIDGPEDDSAARRLSPVEPNAIDTGPLAPTATQEPPETPADTKRSLDATRSYTFEFRSLDREAPIAGAHVLFRPRRDGGSGAAACHVYLDRAAGTLVLLDDRGDASSAGTIGRDGVLRNSRCEVVLNGASTATLGNVTRLRLHVAFSEPFGEPAEPYTQTSDAQGQASGWMSTSEAGPIAAREEGDSSTAQERRQLRDRAPD